jgi:hypothetical protein
MPAKHPPDLSLFLDILQTLNRINAPYMIIGAFAGTIYGITRVTYDIDIVVDLNEEHIEAISRAYPLPRYYADPEMIRNSIGMGIMFNIIDTNRGEKADLVPLSGTIRYEYAFQNRVRKLVSIPGTEPFEVWVARPEDVILGKFKAWVEGRSRKHETDIYEMMVFHYLGEDDDEETPFDEHYVDEQVNRMGADVIELWQAIKNSARKNTATDQD